MELSFVLAALRRRWWVVLYVAQFGLWPFFLLGGGAATYQSAGLLEILEPDDVFSFSSVPDRYLLSQLEVLQSSGFAGQVVESLGGDISIEALAAVTEMEHLPETDVVLIKAITGDAEESQAIVQAYLDVYTTMLVEEENSVKVPLLEEYQTQLEAAELRLGVVVTELADLLQRHRDKYTNVNSTLGVIDPDSVPGAGILAVEKNRLIVDIARFDQLKNGLVDEQSKINSRVLESASLASAPLPSSSNTIKYAILFGFIVLGVSTAITWARFSAMVLDATAASDILGLPFLTSLSRHRALKGQPMSALERLPQEHITRIDQLCVRAEALGQIERPLVVTVVGSQRGAGSTTTALSIAARMAAAEFRVVVVDGDRRDPWLSYAFSANSRGGLSALLENQGTIDRILTRTQEPDVRILGSGDRSIGLRRDHVPAIVDSTRRVADVVIIDGGPLLEAASTVEFCGQADAIVLVVPIGKQRSDDLAAVARQLELVQDKVLPVRSRPSSRVAQARTGMAVEVPRPTEGTPVNGQASSRPPARTRRGPAERAKEA